MSAPDPERAALERDHAYPPSAPFWQLGLVPRLGAPAAVMTGWLAAVLLALTGRRRGLLFAVLVWPVAIVSWRGRVRRSSHALPA